MYEDCQSVSTLNAARHADSVGLMAELNEGHINDAQWQKESDAISDAYEKRINEIWSAAQRVRDQKAVTAAEALGFKTSDFATWKDVGRASKRYSDMALAGLPVKGPQVDAALVKINHVAEVLSDASAAYERLTK